MPILGGDYLGSYGDDGGGGVSPTITSISPSTASDIGGVSITITGTGFETDATVDFDGTPATSVVVVSSTSITCVVPAHVAGVAAVNVINIALATYVVDSFTYTLSILDGVGTSDGTSTMVGVGSLIVPSSIEFVDVRNSAALGFSGPTELAAFSPSPAIGDTIVVAYFGYRFGDFSARLAPTDTYGNPYTEIGYAYQVSGLGPMSGVSVWCSQNIQFTGSSFKVTVRPGSGSSVAIALTNVDAFSLNNDVVTDTGDGGGVIGSVSTGASGGGAPPGSIFLAFVNGDQMDPVNTTEPVDWNDLDHNLTSAMKIRMRGAPAFDQFEGLADYRIGVSTETAIWSFSVVRWWSTVIVSFKEGPLVSGVGTIEGTSTMNGIGELLTDTETPLGPPDPIDDDHPPEHNPPITMRLDKSQLRNRILAQGHGESVLTDVYSDEPTIPVANADAWFNPSGGRAVSRSQRFDYTGVQPGGPEVLVGPGITPVARPRMTASIGTGLDAGPHEWGFTWVTALGETKLSPLSLSFVSETMPAAPVIDHIDTQPGTGGLQPQYDGPTAGKTVTYATAVLKDGFALDPRSVYNSVATPSYGASDLVIHTSFVAAGNTQYKPIFVSTAPLIGRIIALYRRDDGELGDNFYFLAYIILGVSIGGDAGFIWDYYPTANGRLLEEHISGASPYFFGPAWADGSYDEVGRAIPENITIGPPDVIARNIYRASGGLGPKLQQTIANNTSTVGAIDSTPNSGLGDDAPVDDTSELEQPTGLILPGASSIITTNWDLATDGWAIVGQQVIRYRGVDGNTLINIPVTGLGSIIAPISYNDHISAAPALTGVTGLVRPLFKGDSVNIFVVRNDLDAQAEMAALETTPDWTSDGIYEHKIADERRNEASLIIVADVELVLFSRPIKTVNYSTRDIKTRLRAPVSFNISTPPITGDLIIVDVNLDEIAVADYNPKFAVSASSVRFSLEDLFRRMAAATGG